MAKQTATGSTRLAKPKVRRKIVKAKTKSSNSKSAKLYVKKNVGQGR